MNTQVSKSAEVSRSPIDLEERESLWALSLSEALNPRHIDIYQKCFDGYRNALSLSPSKIQSIGLVKARRNFEGRDFLLRRLEEVKAQCRKLDIQTVTLIDREYPVGLRESYNPPLVLYYRGRLRKYYPDKRGSYLAIVGTRRSDSMAETITQNLAREFTSLGGHIVSGLAIGIDTYAHLGALEGISSGKSGTTSVLGCGVDVPYPWGNRKLYQRILDSGGAVISEYLPGTPPLAYNFPSRNRIISALSEGVLITQAPLRSGALITVDFALDQGRSIFAYDYREDVSGEIPDRNAGNYKLIREGAGAVVSLEDLFDQQFGFLKKKMEKGGRKNQESGDSKDFSEKPVNPAEGDPVKWLKAALGEALRSGPQTLSQLSHRLQREVGEISPLLLEGVIEGKIMEMPGKKYFLGNQGK